MAPSLHLPQNPDSTRTPQAATPATPIPQAKMPAVPPRGGITPSADNQAPARETAPNTRKVSGLRWALYETLGWEIDGVRNPTRVDTQKKTNAQPNRQQMSSEDQVVGFVQNDTSPILWGALKQFKESGVDLLAKAGRAVAYAADHKLQAVIVSAVAVGAAVAATTAISAAAAGAPILTGAVLIGLPLAYHLGVLQPLGGPRGLFGAISDGNGENIGREAVHTGLSVIGSTPVFVGLLKGAKAAAVGGKTVLSYLSFQGAGLISRSAEREASSASGGSTASPGDALAATTEAMAAEGRIESSQAIQATRDSVAKPLVDAAMFVFNQFSAERGVVLKQDQKTAARNLYIDVALEWKETLEMQTASRDVAADLGTVGSTLSERQRGLFSDITGQFYSEIQRRWRSSGSPGDENAVRLDAETLRRLDPREPGQDGQVIDVKGRTLTVLESPKEAPKKWGNR